MTTAAVTAAPSSPFCPSHKVTVVGAGNVGSSLAQRLLDHDLADVVLLDIVAGRPQGVAPDLAQAQGMGQRHRHIIGSNDYADSAQSDVIVVTAGLPRRPGMGRDDLLQVNGKIVTETIRQALAYSPNAHIIVVTNPLDVMTYLAWKVSGLPPQRVMGMGGVLDSARFQTFVAWELGVPPGDVSALVLGGHGDLMVPLPAYTTVSGIPVTEFLPADRLATLMERTRQGEPRLCSCSNRGSLLRPWHGYLRDDRSDLAGTVTTAASGGPPRRTVWP